LKVNLLLLLWDSVTLGYSGTPHLLGMADPKPCSSQIRTNNDSDYRFRTVFRLPTSAVAQCGVYQKVRLLPLTNISNLISNGIIDIIPPRGNAPLH